MAEGTSDSCNCLIPSEYFRVWALPFGGGGGRRNGGWCDVRRRVEGPIVTRCCDKPQRHIAVASKLSTEIGKKPPDHVTTTLDLFLQAK